MTRIPSPGGYALLLLLPLAAGAFASVGLWSIEWHLCVAAVAVLSLVYWFRANGHHLRRSFERRITWLALLPPAYVALQLLPLPLPVLRLLSPHRAELTEALGAVMPAPTFASLSVEPAATLMALATVLACATCFLLVRLLAWRALRQASWITVIPLMGLAVFEGGVAIWQWSIGSEAAGTYWNRNHLSGLLEMVLPLAIAYALHVKRRNGGAIVPMASIAIIVLGVVASGSKLGFISMIAGVLAMGLVLSLTRLSGKARWVAIAALPALGIIAFVTLVNRDVLVNMANLMDSPAGMTGEGRLPIWRDTIRLFSSSPLMGTGLGTYSTAFLGFQTTGLVNHWTHAHNDYLEFATDLGIVGYGLFGALLLPVIWRAFTLAGAPRRSGSDLVALGCLGGMAAIALHSVGDFNLYMPANTMLLAWIAGLAAGVPEPRPARPEARSSESPSGGLEGSRGDRRGGRVFTPGNLALGLSIVTLLVSLVTITRASRGESTAAPTLDARLDAVRHSPASPFAWLDAAEALAAAGRPVEGKAAVDQAMLLGEHVLRVTQRAATLYDTFGDRPRAVALMSRDLRQPGADPNDVFGWFIERRISNADVLAGIASDAVALPAFVRYLMLPGTCPDAAKAWRELVTRHRPDPRLAGDYVNFVTGDCGRPDDAAQAWTDYGRLVSPGYRSSEFVFNGGFEADPAPVQFDWRWNERAREAEATIDTTEKFAGARSLRIVFRGSSNTTYDGAFQTLAVEPGEYRFSASVRTSELSGAGGICFRITGGSGAARVDLRTEQATGTTPWRALSTNVVVPEGVTRLRIQVMRQPGSQAEKEGDSSGTAWVDEVSLTKVR